VASAPTHLNHLYRGTFLFGLACGISLALTSLFLDAAGYTKQDIGILALFFAAGLVLFALPVGAVIRRFSGKRTLTVMLIGYAFAVALFPYMRGFEAVAMAQVSSSAFEAKERGFLAASDGVTFHKLRVISDAKRRAVALAERGWVPPDVDEPIRVVGERGAANLAMGLHLFGWGGYASAHDQLIGRKVVHVLSGGAGSHDKPVTAQFLLDLEREAFVSLCGEEKTFARIEFMLKNKKPLRN